MVSFLRPDLAEFAAYRVQPPAADGPPSNSVDVLDTNECPYDLPAELKAKLAWSYQQEIAANRYPDGGHGGLKSAIADYVIESADLGKGTIGPEHISVGNGSDELIRSLLIATCGGREGAILVASPTFSMYGILAQTLGIPVVTVPRDPITFAVDEEGVAAAIATSPVPVRMVFMVHPNSPTANALTPGELDWLHQLPTNILVVVDEAYFEFSQHTTVADVLTRPNWVVTRTFSKAFRLAAHRVGYGIAPPTLTQVLEKVRLPYNLPSFSQAAARLALAHRQELLAIIPELLAQRQHLQAALATLEDFIVWPSAANFLYARPTAISPEILFTRLRHQGTHVRHISGGLRITIGTPEENSRTLDHLRQALAEG
ncbi:histidinol-phosphate transaminase [Leptolyngbya sp. PCC 6406]|uniref:histidinol-phosphate transaminase n=1 Tax=Leptolyngbya sp. PCC 6406 TaxID=1173264 RepID=UPI0002AC1976|nr:histidinol-phosphate transaminase [Leptolyngbya sp. PCC 6406]